MYNTLTYSDVRGFCAALAQELPKLSLYVGEGPEAGVKAYIYDQPLAAWEQQ